MPRKYFLWGAVFLLAAEFFAADSHAQEPTIAETRAFLESNGVRFFPAIFDAENPCAVNLQNNWFYFSDLDASRILVVDMPKMSSELAVGSGVGKFAVQLNTVNNEPRLRMPHPTRTSLQDAVGGRETWNVIGFTSRDQADRVAKAFRHAIKLCGGNSDFFGEK